MCISEPILPCDCDAQSPLEMGLFELSPVAPRRAESGKIGAQVNEPPAAYLEVRDRGLSSTAKESTDA